MAGRNHLSYATDTRTSLEGMPAQVTSLQPEPHEVLVCSVKASLVPLEDPASTGAMSQETGIGTPGAGKLNNLDNGCKILYVQVRCVKVLHVKEVNCV